jgi:hypothetical protein
LDWLWFAIPLVSAVVGVVVVTNGGMIGMPDTRVEITNPELIEHAPLLIAYWDLLDRFRSQTARDMECRGCHGMKKSEQKTKHGKE